MKIKPATSHTRKVDEALTITDMLSDKDFSFDFVIADLDGEHPAHINKISDRIYFILEGEGRVSVGGEISAVVKDDLVKIPKNTVHSIGGKLRYVIITSPPFDPRNEEEVK